jgi:predicted AAA+ superfamily ATPase
VNDRAQTSPGKETIRALLEGQKALILVDELLEYQVKAAGVRVGDTNLQAQTFAFLQELTEVVGSASGVALITTFPESQTEYYDHEQAEQVFNRLEKIFGRVQAVRIPVQGEEILEVVRRRLFENIDEAKAKQVIAQYQSLYTTHREDLPSEVRSSDFGKRMMRAYPFHPELITVLYERWGTLQTFQKTRGVLRLLARIIEYSYMSPAARPLISLGDVGLEDGNLRTTLTSILKDANWDAVIAADIAPGKAQQLDKEVGGEYARYRLSQAVTSSIFMYSHSGGGSERGVTEPRLRLALLQPEGITSVLVSDALSRMKDKLYYLYSNGGWSFKAQPNLNAVLAERTSQVKPEAALEKLKEALTSKIGAGLFKSFVWATDSREVSDNTAERFEQSAY